MRFEFAALDFTAPERNRFAYRLRGFDPDLVAEVTLGLERHGITVRDDAVAARLWAESERLVGLGVSSVAG